MSGIPVVAVVGPTASGKTELAISLCRTLGGEVVSADSMQLYKGLSIATAKPTVSEQQAARHHLIDLLEPWQSFSVAQYTELAAKVIAELHGRGCIPVLAGGTGLYIRSLIDNITFVPQERDEQYRQSLRDMAAERGNEAVHELLRCCDPQTAEELHPNNLERVIRALEIYHTTGITMTEQRLRSRSRPSPYRVCMLGIGYRDRALLNERINRRVDLMMERGLLEEIRALEGVTLSHTARQAIGYKELLPYLEGEITQEQAVEDIKLRSRQYAKRQMTWFNREKDINWLWAEDYADSQLLAQAALRLIFQRLPELKQGGEPYEI